MRQYHIFRIGMKIQKNLGRARRVRSMHTWYEMAQTVAIVSPEEFLKLIELFSIFETVCIDLVQRWYGSVS